MATQLYAKIKKSSEYFHQNPKDPFPVELANCPDTHPVIGNDNRYRLRDVTFYIKAGNGAMVKIS